MSTQNVSGTNDPTLRAQESAVPSVDPDGLARAGSAAVQQSMTGLPNISIKEAIVSDELRSMLNQAGLQRTESGAIAILDVTGASALDGLAAAQRVYGAGESQLSPAMPPSVTLTPELNTGAQSFATNFDIAMNNYLLTANPTTPNPVAASGVGTTTLGAANPGEALYFKSLAELSSDDLLAAFLKVNINDPNNDPEMHNKLHAIATNMRQLAIEEAKKRIERAQEAKKEAEEYAQQAEYISTIVTVVSLVASVFTLGASLAATVAVEATKQAAVQAAKTAVTESLKEAVKQAVKQAVQELGQNASQEAIQQAVQQAVQETLQQTGQQAIQQMTQQATQTALQEGLQQGTQEAVQKAVQEAISESLKESVQQGVQQGLQESTAQIATDVAADAAVQGLEQGVSQATQETVQQTVQQAVQQQTQTAGQSAVQQGAQDVGQSAAQDAGQSTAQDGAQQSVRQQAQEGLIKAGENTTLKNVGIATSVGGKVVEGGANYEAAMKNADVAELQNEAARWELTADHHQDQIEEEGQIMKDIMESKNQTVDAVMSMMNASFVSKQKLMAANMTR